VLAADRFQAIIHLLNVFGSVSGGTNANRHIIAARRAIPPRGQRQAIVQTVEEPITLTRVVRHVNVSRFYFCKLFKKAHRHDADRIRVARPHRESQTLLVIHPCESRKSSMPRVSVSIPRFNSVFKRYVGMPADRVPRRTPLAIAGLRRSRQGFVPGRSNFFCVD